MMKTRQEMILSKENPQIKLIKSLQQKKYRNQHGLYMIEGVRNCEAALAGKAEIVKAFYSETLLASERGAALLTAVQEKEIPIFLCEEKVMAHCSDATTCQGMILLAKIPRERPIQEVVTSPLLVLDGIQDPGNLGTILRTAWAAGIKTVALLSGTVDSYSPKVVRSAMGALYYLDILTVEDAAVFYQSLLAMDYEIWTTSVSQGIDYRKAKKGDRWALVIGGEANGVRDVSLQYATHLVTIPMAEGAESLNAAVAAGILMFG